MHYSAVIYSSDLLSFNTFVVLLMLCLIKSFKSIGVVDSTAHLLSSALAFSRDAYRISQEQAGLHRKAKADGLCTGSGAGCA